MKIDVLNLVNSCVDYSHLLITEIMMTSSNGSIFRVTGSLCGEFTGPGEFPAQRPVTRNFDVFFDLRLNKRLSKQPRGWWFETPSWSLWRHRNVHWKVFVLLVCKILLQYVGYWWHWQCSKSEKRLGITSSSIFPISFLNRNGKLKWIQLQSCCKYPYDSFFKLKYITCTSKPSLGLSNFALHQYLK